MPYLLTFCTSDLPGASTDADVFATLHGARGSSARVRLPAKAQDFGRGQRDRFRVALPDVGPLQRLTVEHNNKGTSPAWHLDQVEVLVESTGKCPKPPPGVSWGPPSCVRMQPGQETSGVPWGANMHSRSFL